MIPMSATTACGHQDYEDASPEQGSSRMAQANSWQPSAMAEWHQMQLLRNCRRATRPGRVCRGLLPPEHSVSKKMSPSIVSPCCPADLVGLNKDSYSIPWVIRNHFLAEIRSSGIPALKLDDTQGRVIIHCFPDSSGEWLQNLWQNKGLETVKEVCDHLSYKHPQLPPEVLTIMDVYLARRPSWRQTLIEHDEEKIVSTLVKSARVEGFSASSVVAVLVVLLKCCLLSPRQ
jgi:hypothetical protein